MAQGEKLGGCMSKYSLFDIPERATVETVVDTFIRNAVGEYEAIKRAYPHSGLGDTATDERLVQRLYGVLHFGVWDWPEKREASYGSESASTPSVEKALP